MKNQQGFTLIEMLLVIALVVICGGIVVDLFISQNRLYRVETAEMNITYDARNTLDDVDNYTRQAYRVVGDSAGYSTDADTLVLQIQSVDASNELIPSTYDYVVFYLTGSDFFREIFPNGASVRPAFVKKLASNVNGIAFTYNDSDLSLVTEVVTDLTLQENAGLYNRAITISSRSTLRNH